MSDDERFMTRALEIARGPSRTSPNPRVGAVIVRNGEVISEGAHQGAGTPHAEAIALEGIDAAGATVYVNLEPCAHHGRMPPCAPALVEAGVARVVAALEDPDDRVAGKGFELLRNAGIEVTTGVLESEARSLNRSYLHHRAAGRPLVTLKLAASLDGRFAAPDGTSKWITSEAARRRVHTRRAEVDAVLVGSGTAISDDPRLTARGGGEVQQPVRVICDSRGHVPASSNVFAGGRSIVMTTLACPQEAMTAWKETGAEVVVVPQDADGRCDLHAVIDDLAGRGWLEIYCEGGAGLATSLLRADLVDVLELNVGPVVLGGAGLGLGDLGIDTMAEASSWRKVELLDMGPDTVIVLERDR